MVVGSLTHVLKLLTRGLYCSHGLRERDRNDLSIANILEKDLGITDYQRVCNIKLILQLIGI